MNNERNENTIIQFENILRKLKDICFKICTELKICLKLEITRISSNEIGDIYGRKDYHNLHKEYASLLPDISMILMGDDFRNFVRTLDDDYKKLRGLKVHHYLDSPGYKMYDLVTRLFQFEGHFFESKSVEIGEKNYMSTLKTRISVSSTLNVIRKFMAQMHTRVMFELRKMFLCEDMVLDLKGRCLIHTGILGLVITDHQTVLNRNNMISPWDVSYRFHLFSDIIVYSEEIDGKYLLQQIIPLDEMRVYNNSPSGSANSFEIHAKGAEFEVVCFSPVDREIWLKFFEKQFIRLKKKRVFKVVFNERPFGMTINPHSLTVTRIVENGLADQNKIKIGDKLMNINGFEPSIERLHSDLPLDLVFRRPKNQISENEKPQILQENNVCVNNYEKKSSEYDLTILKKMKDKLFMAGGDRIEGIFIKYPESEDFERTLHEFKSGNIDNSICSNPFIISLCIKE